MSWLSSQNDLLATVLHFQSKQYSISRLYHTIVNGLMHWMYSKFWLWTDNYNLIINVFPTNVWTSNRKWKTYLVVEEFTAFLFLLLLVNSLVLSPTAYSLQLQEHFGPFKWKVIEVLNRFWERSFKLSGKIIHEVKVCIFYNVPSY